MDTGGKGYVFNQGALLYLNIKKNYFVLYFFNEFVFSVCFRTQILSTFVSISCQFFLLFYNHVYRKSIGRTSSTGCKIELDPDSVSA